MRTNEGQRDWQVLLIGGASGVGKTGLSYRLAHHFAVGITEVDDFQCILEQMTTPAQQPLLHYWRTHPDEVSGWAAAQRHAHFLSVCRTIYSPAMAAVIANRLAGGSPVIYEGDFIPPELAAMAHYGPVAAAGQVRAVFLYEEDEEQVASNFLQREGRLQPDRAHSSWLFGQWLRAECHRLNLPAPAARPWHSLFERIAGPLAAANQSFLHNTEIW